MKWQAWELAHFGNAARMLIFQRLLKPMFGLGAPDAARVEEEERNFKQFAAVLDRQLGQGKFLVGGQLTLADFCVASTLTYKEPAQLPVAEFANVRSWLGALDETPGWRASAPPPM